MSKSCELKSQRSQETLGKQQGYEPASNEGFHLGLQPEIWPDNPRGAFYI